MKPFDPRLLRVVPDSRAGIVGLLALGAVQGLAAIGQAFAIAALVVAVAQNAPWWPAATATAVAFAVRALATGVTEVVAVRTGVAVSGAIRRLLLTAALHRDAASRDAGARLLTLATQGATSIEPYVARYLPTLANAAILPPAAILAMLLLDWRTGLIPVLTVPLLPLFAALIGSATAEATQRRWRTLAGLSGHFLDVMRGLPTLVTYGRARRQTETIRTVSHQHRAATVRTLRLAFVSSAALELLATISVAIVAVWVGIQLAEDQMSLALAMPLILLAPEAYWPIRRVGAEFHNAADGANALDAVLQELGEQPAAVESARVTGVSEPQQTAPVRLRGVRYAYGEGLPVILDGIDADLPSPGLTVMIGPSGVGKTTLVEIVAGLRQPDAGTVEAPPAHLITQRPFLAAATLRDNLLLGCAGRSGGMPTDGHLRKALADVGLTDMVRSLPLGLDTPVGDDGFGLSAGQRARIALARAVLADPPMVVLDEPTAHLDREAEALIDDLVVSMSRTRPVVVVTHRQGLLRRADRVLDLGGGA
ncbi:thiol reductant ABC exporter subunit CydD [Austwickia sp. TVS 96-490-7B]|uniref:thiol reductant ABC exporter subunit CydD n=1 Tax=Austwickia sp. TVS 96-490-7B TaxID=2830843 RepID=UPI001C584E5D|nr:thiol reductant ABC exporter subunit CydD [Austwickia sp. TVS 96-490-7B]